MVKNKVVENEEEQEKTETIAETDAARETETIAETHAKTAEADANKEIIAKTTAETEINAVVPQVLLTRLATQ